MTFKLNNGWKEHFNDAQHVIVRVFYNLFKVQVFGLSITCPYAWQILTIYSSDVKQQFCCHTAISRRKEEKQLGSMNPYVILNKWIHSKTGQVASRVSIAIKEEISK